MSFLPGMFPAAAGLAAAIAASVVLTDSFSSETDTTSYSSTRAFGTEDPSRYMIIAVTCANLSLASDLPSSVSIGGVSCSMVVGSTGLRTYSLWITDSPVPTGTTGNVTVTRTSTNFSNIAYVLWAAYNLQSNVGIDSANDFETDPNTNQVDVQSGGIVVAAGFLVGTDTTFTWTGVTEEFDSNTLAIASMTMSAGSLSNTPTQSNYSVVSDTASNSSHQQITASFR